MSLYLQIFFENSLPKFFKSSLFTFEKLLVLILNLLCVLKIFSGTGNNPPKMFSDNPLALFCPLKISPKSNCRLKCPKIPQFHLDVM